MWKAESFYVLHWDPQRCGSYWSSSAMLGHEMVDYTNKISNNKTSKILNEPHSQMNQSQRKTIVLKTKLIHHILWNQPLISHKIRWIKIVWFEYVGLKIAEVTHVKSKCLLRHLIGNICQNLARTEPHPIAVSLKLRSWLNMVLNLVRVLINPGRLGKCWELSVYVSTIKQPLVEAWHCTQPWVEKYVSTQMKWKVLFWLHTISMI